MPQKSLFENCKNCVEATHIESKRSYLEKTKIKIDSPKKSLRKHNKQ